MAKILIADDEAPYAKGLKALLVAKGMSTVKVVTDAQKLLESIEVFQPSIVILDIMWKDSVAGPDLAVAIRELPACGSTVIVYNSDKLMSDKDPPYRQDASGCWLAAKDLGGESLFAFLKKQGFV